MEIQLEKNNPIPLYQQIANDIRQEIDSSRLTENARLPSEQALCKRYDVSRITVRKALSVLVEEGYLVSRHGIGSFVAPRKVARTFSTQSIISFTRTCIQQGRVPSSKVLGIEVVPVPAWVTARIKEDEASRQVIRIRRIRFADEHPVIIEENYFSLKYSDLLQKDLSGSLFDRLAEMGVYPASCLREMDIFQANAEEASILEVAQNTPLLGCRDVTRDQNGALVFCGKEIINPKRYKFIIQL